MNRNRQGKDRDGAERIEGEREGRGLMMRLKVDEEICVFCHIGATGKREGGRGREREREEGGGGGWWSLNKRERGNWKEICI